MSDQLQFPQVKAANSNLDYSVDWSAWLALDNDAIATVTFTIAPVSAPDAPLPLLPGDCVVTPAAPPINMGLVSCWISGGIPGRLYALTCAIVTVAAAGAHARADQRTVLLQVV